MKTVLPWIIVLTACSGASDQRGQTAQRAAAMESVKSPSATPAGLPDKYLKALACMFDENPLVAYRRTHETPAGRAERAEDLKALRSLGFTREGRDGDLETVGGEIAAPPGMTLLGLPVRRIELNGMIGDVNAMYITTFGDRVTVDQVVRGARLDLDRKSYDRYRMRHYSRLIGNSPHTELSLDDLGDGRVALVCQIQSTPD